MKLKFILANLMVLMGLSFPSFAGPSHVQFEFRGVENSGTTYHGYGCQGENKSNDFKISCGKPDHDTSSSTFGINVKAKTKDGKEVKCVLAGRNYASGMFDQNWHHRLNVDLGQKNCQAINTDNNNNFKVVVTP